MEPCLELLSSVWAQIAEVCTDLDEPAWDRATDCPGWSVKDNVAHMIGTERSLLGEQPPASDGGDGPHVRNDIGRLNEQWVASYRTLPGPAVLAAFIDVAQQRVAQLGALSNAEWDAEGFTPEGPGPYRQFMAIRVFDCWFHEQDIREALGRPGGLEGPVADHSLGRIVRGLPFVVGKKAAAPQGTTVVFDVRGTPPIEVAIGVDGRAAVIDAAPGAPNARVTLDRRTYARLAGGRWDGARARAEGAVDVEGDRALGDRIVDNMGFTV